MIQAVLKKYNTGIQRWVGNGEDGKEIQDVSEMQMDLDLPEFSESGKGGQEYDK